MVALPDLQTARRTAVRVSIEPDISQGTTAPSGRGMETEAQLAEIAQEVLRMTRALCFSGPGEGRRLDYGEAFSVAARHARLRHGLSPRHVRTIIRICGRT